MIIEFRKPLKLVEEGMIVSPYCDFYGNCALNNTINMYSYCTLRPKKDVKNKFIAPILNQVVKYDCSCFNDYNEKKHLKSR